LNANVISRARGQSIVAAAAYRAGARLRDERYGVVHNYVGRRICAHAEIMAPDGTPEWVRDRELLWNRVEAAEPRKDSQLARLIELGLPTELSHAQSLALLRDYIASVFVARGMIADFYVRCDNPDNPHAHILLTLRGVTPVGFGPKERRWNGKANLLEWRAAWADRVNRHLAQAGHAVRIDHRTLEAQQLELVPARRMGIGRSAAVGLDLPEHLAERVLEQRRIAGANGALIIEDPTVALRALTHRAPAFSESDLKRFLRSRTEAGAQFDAALRAVLQSPELIPLPQAPGVARRFTSSDMQSAAKSLARRVTAMAGRRTHSLAPHDRMPALSRLPHPDGVMAHAFADLMGVGAAKAVALGDDGKAQLIEAVAAASSAAGFAVVRVTPQMLCGIELELHARSLLLIEDAELLGLKALERAVGAADAARAKVVLVADLPRLQAMGDDAPFAIVLRALALIRGSAHE
jgi:hypothetical protein